MATATPDLSIIIPVHNRAELIHYTLESVRRATAGMAAEVIVVDDGSDQPIAGTIARLGYTPTNIIRQPNQGLLFARLNGLAAATGRHTVFLDSDDLVSVDKFRLQVAALDATQAAVSYTDSAHTVLTGSYADLVIAPSMPCEETEDATTLFIRVQPPPHSTVFRTIFLQRIVAQASFPPSRLYNSVAEIWFFHNAAIYPARAVKVRGPHTIVGAHPGQRLTNHWERLAIASLAVMEAFARACPRTEATAHARQLVAEKAFNSWRRLPRGFSAEFVHRQRQLWRQLNQRTALERLGGRGFQRLARLLGPVRAALILKLVQNQPYRSCQTLSTSNVAELLAGIPAADWAP
jgi:hypothetical protein